MKLRDLGLSYDDAMHGVQSSVAFEHSMGSDDGSPKHLRVGITSSQVTELGIASLLIEKGIFTLEEYVEAVRLAANDELKRCEERHGVTFR